MADGWLIYFCWRPGAQDADAKVMGKHRILQVYQVDFTGADGRKHIRLHNQVIPWQRTHWHLFLWSALMIMTALAELFSTIADIEDT